ncbi:hypothetical protein BOX15_Mlig008640g4, partial [Macrostomum lignano]
AMSYKEREHLNRLIISQLYYDGHQSIAVKLNSLVNDKSVPCGPSSRLLNLVRTGLSLEEEEKEKAMHDANAVEPGTGIDLEIESETVAKSPEAALYETCYVTSHKAPCRSAAFSPSGQLVCTGSTDASIKILDIERMLLKGMGGDDGSSESHPVIRTLYDHTEEVTCLEFHPDPRLTLLASASKDYYVKLFDYSNPSVKKAQRSLREASPVRTFCFHPSGNYMIVGCDQPTLRVYDVSTGQCFVSCNPNDQHTRALTMLRWAGSGQYYCSASKDGCLKLWDGVSGRCVANFERAHDGYEVCSAVFSRNGKYILSSGKDSQVKLWELSTGRPLITYTGAGASGRQSHRTNAVFNHTEDFVMFPDEATKSLCCWDSRSADRQRLLALSHNGVVRFMTHSTTMPAFISCSDDHRARFWYKKALTE